MSPHRNVILCLTAVLGFWIGVYIFAVCRVWETFGWFSLLFVGYLVTSAIVTTSLWALVGLVVYKIAANLWRRSRS